MDVLKLTIKQHKPKLIEIITREKAYFPALWLFRQYPFEYFAVKNIYINMYFYMFNKRENNNIQNNNSYDLIF